MREVGGQAVLWATGQDLAVIAELVDLAVRESSLRAELIERGRKQRERYAPEVALGLLREAVDAALSVRSPQ
jgi:hypothetical protein